MSTSAPAERNSLVQSMTICSDGTRTGNHKGAQRLARLGRNLPGVLNDQLPLNVNMFQAERHQGAITSQRAHILNT